MTDYIVFAFNGDGWQEHARFQARSTEAAVKQVDSGGVFVAVPARSWKPVKVSAQTKTTYTVEAVGE